MPGEYKMLSPERQTELRKLYDAGVNKNKAKEMTGIAEATVYRYYAKWKALDDAHQSNVFDFTHLHPSVLTELKIQAGMRRMTLYSFVYNLLTVIITDNLSKSIIDIEDDNPKKKRLSKNAG